MRGIASYVQSVHCRALCSTMPRLRMVWLWHAFWKAKTRGQEAGEERVTPGTKWVVPYLESVWVSAGMRFSPRPPCPNLIFPSIIFHLTLSLTQCIIVSERWEKKEVNIAPTITQNIIPMRNHEQRTNTKHFTRNRNQTFPQGTLPSVGASKWKRKRGRHFERP